MQLSNVPAWETTFFSGDGTTGLQFQKLQHGDCCFPQAMMHYTASSL